MSCPTCDHTMQLQFMDRERTIHHCPRCGTMRSELLGDVSFTVPALVERCRRFEAEEFVQWSAEKGEAVIRPAVRWHQLGIAEAINKPEGRPR